MPIGERYLTVNLADIGTLTTDSAVVGLPVTELQDPQPARAYRAGANSCYLLLDMLASYAINFVGLFGFEGTAAITRRTRVSTVDSTGAAGDGGDSGTATASVSTTFQQLLHFLPSTYTGRYVRLDLADSVPPEAGRLVIGALTTPTRGFQFPADFTAEDLSRVQETVRGNAFVDVGPVRRIMDFTLPALTEAEAWAWLSNDIANGAIADMLIALDVNDSTYLHHKTMWAMRKETTPISWRGHGLFGRRFRLTERISDSR